MKINSKKIILLTDRIHITESCESYRLFERWKENPSLKFEKPQRL